MNRRHFLAGLPVMAAAARGAASTIRVGIIGSGNRGRRHIEFINAMKGRAAVVALADIDDAQLAQSRKLLSGKAAVYKDYRALIDDKQVDAIVVSTPNFLHREHATAAIAGGRHVLCEKPLATSVEDARAILDAASRTKKIFLVGHELRFAPVYLRMKELIGQGRIGRVCQILHTELRSDWNPRGWRYRDPKTGKETNWRLLNYPTGGTLVEKSCHFTDLYLMMIGENPSRAVCSGGVHFYRDGRETMDHANLAMEYAGGPRVNHALSLYHRPALDEFRVLGSDGAMLSTHHKTLDFYPYGSKPERILSPETAKVESDHVPRHSGDLEMYEAFLAAITEGTKLPFDNDIALYAVKTCLMGEIAARERRTVEWGEMAG